MVYRKCSHKVEIDEKEGDFFWNFSRKYVKGKMIFF